VYKTNIATLDQGGYALKRINAENQEISVEQLSQLFRVTIGTIVRQYIFLGDDWDNRATMLDCDGAVDFQQIADAVQKPIGGERFLHEIVGTSRTQVRHLVLFDHT
jgi:hypothetical protein